jgi:phosphomannomutase
VPEVHPTHDSAAAIGLILEHLARENAKISELVNQLPEVTMLKHNIAVEPNRLYSLLQRFRLLIENEQLAHDLSDGIKVTFVDGWVHVRASNTESIIRIIVEAEDSNRAQQLIEWARDRIGR